MPTLLDVKMRVPAGSLVVWNGYPYTDQDYTAMVVMPGPVPSSVWALDSAGGWLCLKWHGKRQVWVDITSAHATAITNPRAAIVAGMVTAHLRRCPVCYVPPEGQEWTREGSDAHVARVTAELTARYWAELYYPVEG